MPTAKGKTSTLWLIIFLATMALIYALRSILLPFVLGCLIGYLLDPLVDWLQKHKINRNIATILVLLSIVLVSVPTIITISYFAELQLKSFINAMPQYIASFNHKIMPLINSLQESFPALSKESALNYLQNNFTQAIQFSGRFFHKIITGGYAIFNIISLLLITPVVAFYMLRDWDNFINHINNILPKSHRKTIQQQALAIDNILSSFIRGQLSVCLILGAFYAIGLSIIRLDLGLVVGFISGIISFIPYVGSITGFILSMAIAFAQFDTISPIIAVAGVFFCGQILEGYFLTPKLVGDSIGLHPLWVMFALLAGGTLLGFLGLMIAVPIAAVIGVLVRYAISEYQKYNA